VNHRDNRDIHRACEKAFAVEIAKTLQAVLARQSSLDPEEQQALLPRLLFGIYARLSGSSFGGRVHGQEVYPVMGFSLGESGDAVYFGAGSALHEQVPSILGALAETKA
jgi:hypothetical protein